MDAKTRSSFIASFLEDHCMSVMGSKGQEYSRGEEDVNSNFKRVAGAIGSDPVTVAYTYLAKHLDSIANFVKTGESPSGEPIEGRVGDAVNYLLILASLIEEAKPVTSGTLEAEVITTGNVVKPRRMLTPAGWEHDERVDGAYDSCSMFGCKPVNAQWVPPLGAKGFGM